MSVIAQPSSSDASLQRCSIISHQETLNETKNILEGQSPGPRGSTGGADWVQKSQPQKMDSHDHFESLLLASGSLPSVCGTDEAHVGLMLLLCEVTFKEVD